MRTAIDGDDHGDDPDEPDDRRDQVRAVLDAVDWLGTHEGAAVTLLPALMGFAGHNVDRFGIPGMKPKVETGSKIDVHTVL